jgi:thiamine-phosphate pyrophosphorylase
VDAQLYLITDGWTSSTVERVDAALRALPAGAAAVQLRAKSLGGRALHDAAGALVEVTRGRALLFVNDRFDVARAAGPDGVHLPSSGLPPRPARRGIDAARGKLLIGCSTHSLAEARMSARAGADFVTFGPVFATASKAAWGAPVGLDALAEVVRALAIPVFALGGIDAAGAAKCRAAGARVACIGAVLGVSDSGAGARSLLCSPTGEPR